MKRPLHVHLSGVAPFAALENAQLEALEPELAPVRVRAGETLMREGEVGDAMFVLVTGELEVHLASEGGGSLTLERLTPAVGVGEMALVAGRRRTATVTARTDAELVELSRAGFERLAERHAGLLESVLAQVAPRLQRIQLSGILEAWFGRHEGGDGRIRRLQDRVDWVRLAAGEVLYRQGEQGNGMYLLVSGRLRATRWEGEEVRVSDVAQGESVGEHAALDDVPRGETVTALRDAHLVRLGRELVSEHPQVILRIARTALARTGARRPRGAGRGNGVRTIALVPAGPGDPAADAAACLAAQLQHRGRVLSLDARAIDRAFGREGASSSAPGDPSDPALTHWLNEREAEHDALVLIGDEGSTAWTLRCLRQADMILMVARAGGDPAPGPSEREAAHVPAGTELLLVHPDDASRPEGTGAWLRERQDVIVHHLRLADASDSARLARRVTGRAVGLVFSGGGARGYVHIGVVRAVEELGIPIDFVGGTSMGALISAAYAYGRSYRFCFDAALSFGDRRKLLDRTLPLVALTRSHGVTETFRHVFGEARLEDTWIPFFCLSANLTRAEPVVHRTGPLWRAVRASTAIPGIFTPIVEDGDVLVDGGVMNGFPVDVMRGLVGTGVVIGSDASSQGSRERTPDFGTSVSGWRVLRERLLTGKRASAYPSLLGTLMRATSLSSKHHSVAARHLADAVLSYPLEGYGNLDFGRVRALVDIGYHVAVEALPQVPSLLAHEAAQDGTRALPGDAATG